MQREKIGSVSYPQVLKNDMKSGKRMYEKTRKAATGMDDGGEQQGAREPSKVETTAIALARVITFKIQPQNPEKEVCRFSLFSNVYSHLSPKLS